MEPGQPCLSCHRSGGEADDEVFSFAGTVYEDGAGTAAVEGVLVTVTDSQAQTVTVVSNAAGNFYSDNTLTPPFQVTLTRGANGVSMTAQTGGECNGCHSPEGQLQQHLYAP